MSLTIYPDEELKEKIKEAGKKKGWSMNLMVVHILKKYFEQKENDKKVDLLD